MNDRHTMNDPATNDRHTTNDPSANDPSANDPSANRHRTVEAIRALGAVAVIRIQDPEALLRSVEAFARGGVRAIEVTMSVPGAIGVIARLRAHFGADLVLGVGSVLDAETATRAVEAGARFVVTPVMKPEVVAAAHAAGAAAMPGAMTPTECQAAHEAGADIVKVFPADIVGMPFFRAVLAPMPHLQLMPTGGVTLCNAADWLRAGAVAVGVGSALVDPVAIAAGDYARLTDHARRLCAAVASAR